MDEGERFVDSCVGHGRQAANGKKTVTAEAEANIRFEQLALGQVCFNIGDPVRLGKKIEPM